MYAMVRSVFTHSKPHNVLLIRTKVQNYFSNSTFVLVQYRSTYVLVQYTEYICTCTVNKVHMYLHSTHNTYALV